MNTPTDPSQSSAPGPQTPLNGFAGQPPGPFDALVRLLMRLKMQRDIQSQVLPFARGQNPEEP